MKWRFMDAKVNRVNDVGTLFELLTMVKPIACCIGARVAKRGISRWAAQISLRCQLIAHHPVALALLHRKY